MRKWQLFLQVEMMLIALSIAIFTLGFTYLNLLVGGYIIIRTYSNPKIPKKVFWLFILLLLSGTLISLVKIGQETYGEFYNQTVFFRIRFFWIRILFALSICMYLMQLEYRKVLQFVFFIALPQLVFGVIELLILREGRIAMLTSEPSAAAMYYIFLSPLLLEYIRYNPKVKLIVVAYLVVGLFIQSKAQILVIPILLTYLIFKSNNLWVKRIFIVAVLLGILLAPLLLSIDQIDRIVYFLEILRAQGIEGLTEQNKIWSTFTLRFSASITAFQVFIENIFGAGFGGYHPLFIEKMTSGTIQSQLTGVEIRATLNNELYATPKSIFMEYLTSCGLFFLIPIILLVRKYILSTASYFIKASFYMTNIIALMVELSPFLTFLAVSFVLFSKFKLEEEKAFKI